MTYIEMCYKIKELLFCINTSLENFKLMSLYYNGHLILGNLRGDIEDISDEINGYIGDIINESQMEIEILNKLDKYIERIVLNYTEVFFEDSEEFHLFEHIVKRINNSFMLRLKSSIYVFERYNTLVNINGFNQHNYKILNRDKYISEEEYKSYLSLSL